MMYVPEFVALYEIIPYIEYLPLNNETIRVAPEDYCKGGDKKDAIIKKYGPIGEWDTSNVTNMSCIFEYCADFNEDISDWDTSSVITMEAMFCCAENFNQPIGKWDVSKVTNMEYMFWSAEIFNQPIGNWDVSKVTNMSFMFQSAKSFNQPIGKWDVSKVTGMNYNMVLKVSINLSGNGMFLR